MGEWVELRTTQSSFPHFFNMNMVVDSLDNHRFSMQLLNRVRSRGRPRTAMPELRNNNYRDEDGRYQLSEGLKPWHERIVDFMVARPSAKIVDIAREFGTSPQWIGQLLKTDAFIEYYKIRMSSYKETVDVQVVAKLQGLALASLDGMVDKVNDTKAPLSFGQLKDTADLSLRALGYTAQPGGVNLTLHNEKNTTVIASTHEAVNKARQKMLEVMKAQTQTSDPANYRQVTASLEKSYQDVEVEETDMKVLEGISDAVVLPDD